MKKHTHTLLRDGFTSIVRSPAFAFATGVVAFLAACMIIAAVSVYGFSDHLRTSISERVDMNVYFFPSTNESIVEQFQAMVTTRPEVAEATIVTRDEALAQFKIRHSNDALTLQALDELNENPLGASVVIRTHEPNQLKTIAILLDSDTDSVKEFYPYIERVNYFDHEEIIGRFNSFSSAVKGVTLAAVVGTLLLVILLMYTLAKVHTVADYDMHETKILLGARHDSIVAPRMISHLVIAATSGILAIVLSVIAAWQLSRVSESFFEGFRFDSYLMSHMGAVCAIVFAVLFLCAIGTTFVAYITTSKNR